MRRQIRLPVLLAATVLVTWHGMLLSLPHTHSDPGVPQTEISCTVSQPGSPTLHLHGEGRVLDSHPCLACLAGSTAAIAWQDVPVAPTAAAPATIVSARPGCRFGIHAHLPNLRAPPHVV